MARKEVEVVGILGSSQGTISIVAALLAGAAGSMLTSVSEEDLRRAGSISTLFMVSACTAVALNLGTAIICILSEQQSKVAQAFSLIHDDPKYDKSLEEWWRSFAVLRTRALWAFLYSIPLVFLTMACQSYITHSNRFGICGFFIFSACGGLVFATILSMNSLFRKYVLNLEGSHAAPIYFTDANEVVGVSTNEEVLSLQYSKSDIGSRNAHSADRLTVKERRRSRTPSKRLHKK